MRGVFARAPLRAVRVDHGDNIHSDVTEVGLECGVLAACDFMDQTEQGFRGGRLIPVLAA